MAEGQVKQVLEREVTCVLCLDIFSEPKKLPCDHVYCKDCLKRLALHQGLAAPTHLACPECRTVTRIPNDNVDEFPTDFRMNRLIEAYQKVDSCERGEDTLDTKQTAKGDSTVTDNCEEHLTQSLALYCETCSKLVCRDCVIMTKSHTHHDYDYVDKAADIHKEKLKETLLLTKEYDEVLTTLHMEISTAVDDVIQQERVEQQQIDGAFHSLMAVLEVKRDDMKRQVSQNSQSIQEALTRQMQQADVAQNEMKELASLIDSTLQGHDRTLLTRQEMLLDRFELIQKKMEELPQNVVTEPLLLPEVITGKKLKQHLDQHCFTYYAADPGKSHIRNFVSRAEADKCYSLLLDLVDFRGNKCRGGKQTVKAELKSIRDNSVTKGRINQLSPHCVQIMFEPHTQGRHELSLRLNGSHIGNSPCTCFLYKNPRQSSQPVATIESLQRPTGLARHGENILAVEHARSRILRLNTAFQVAGSIGEGILKGPSEVTADGNMNIYVCTIRDNKVHKFSKDGTLIKSIGMTGTRPGQFNFPNGVRINNYGELYVCDSGNNRMQVFDLDLNFKRVFGSQGSGKGQFKCPSDVDFDADDNVYIVDTNNHRIQVFSPQEQYLRAIGQKRFGSKELVSPINMHISDDQLFITEHEKNHVTVFKTSGELLTTFGNGVLSNPEGIEVDEDGFVYVTSDYSRIVVY